MNYISPQTLMVLVLALVCAFTDWRKGLVHNAFTYPAAAIGLTLSFVYAPPEPFGSLLGFLAALGSFGILWYFGGIGAGDVKLMAAIGAMKGLPFITYSSIYIIFIAAMVGIVVLALRGRLLRTIKWMCLTYISVVIPGMSPPELGDEKTYIPFAPFIFLGVTVAAYQEYMHGPINFT